MQIRDRTEPPLSKKVENGQVGDPSHSCCSAVVRCLIATGVKGVMTLHSDTERPHGFLHDAALLPLYHDAT